LVGEGSAPIGPYSAFQKPSRKLDHSPIALYLARMVLALKARYVFSAASAPIADGMVAIDGEYIKAVGKDLAADAVEELGNVAILPGLVNAHTHLEFSDLARPFGAPGIGFADWIRLVQDYRQNTRPNTIAALQSGLHECTRFGVTAIGEIAQPEGLEALNKYDSLEGTAFLELIAPTADRVPAAVDLAVRCVKRTETEPDLRILNPEPRTLAPEPSHWQIGLSPHAPYSVHSDLLGKIIELSVRSRIPLAMHMAESREELQLLAETNGPLKELLVDLHAYEQGDRAEVSRPLDYLQMLAVAASAMVVHGNYLTRDEIGLLADHAESMAVSYCPRSHEFFGHDRYPLEQMLSADATVCLGTDSRASAPDLDLLAEIRHVARHYPQVGPLHVLQLGTLNGAKALGRSATIGTLEPGKYANLAIVPLPRRKRDGPYQLLFNADEPAVATWFRGKKVFG
jgi:cytosine/adenosine deaminase-related metal-dependent hydrolase